MFENTLLESSPRRLPALRPVHYLVSSLLATLVFALSLHLLSRELLPVAPHGVLAAPALAGIAAGLETLMLCYVWADAREHHLAAWPWLVTTLVLSLPGFLIYLVFAAARSGDWKRAAIHLAYVVETLFIGILILLPLIYTQALPKASCGLGVHIAPPAGPPPGAAAPPRATPARRAAVNSLEAPARIPKSVQIVVEVPELPESPPAAGPWVEGAIAGSGRPGGPGILDGLPGGTQPPPPPPERYSVPRPRIIHVGGQVIAAEAVYQPAPVYSPLAIAARVQGTVVLEAIIGKDGRVQNLKVVSGPALLVRAALDAVKTWRYQPTLLNGEPVDVVTEISVNFTLAQ